MRINKINILTEVEGKEFEEYEGGKVSKFSLKEYKYVKVIKQTQNIKGGIGGIVFKCRCGKLFHLTISKLSYQGVNNDIVDINCGCIQKKSVDDEINKAKEIFYSSKPQSKTNPCWCTYCKSYRPEVTQKSKNTFHCINCDFLINKKVVLGETFDEIMKKWDSTTHKQCIKKLPYLEGNNKKGYKVRGFTYISADWYDEACKWLWIKSKYYVKTSFSKENLDRVGKLHLYKPLKDRKHKYMFLHRFILGLGNGIDMVGDHINGCKLNNKNSNLRSISTYQNSLNSKKKDKTTSSLYKGVCKLRTEQRNKKWKSSLTLRTGKCIQRYHITEIDAAKCYDDMLRKHLPNEIHRFNFPRDGELSAI